MRLGERFQPGTRPRLTLNLSSAWPMDEALAFAISVFIVCLGGWIFVAGLSSPAPAFWFATALVPIAIGLWSAFGYK
jgi:hypothetical protein